MNVREAAKRLEVSQSLVYSLIAAGRLKCHRIGNGRGAIRVAEEHIAEFLNGAAPPKPVEPIRPPRLKHVRVRTS